MTGVAVKVTVVPAQMGLAGAPTMVTEAGRAAVTVTVIAVEVAVVGAAHDKLEVRMTVT